MKIEPSIGSIGVAGDRSGRRRAYAAFPEYLPSISVIGSYQPESVKTEATAVEPIVEPERLPAAPPSPGVGVLWMAQPYRYARRSRRSRRSRNWLKVCIRSLFRVKAAGAV